MQQTTGVPAFEGKHILNAETTTALTSVCLYAAQLLLQTRPMYSGSLELDITFVRAPHVSITPCMVCAWLYPDLQ